MKRALRWYDYVTVNIYWLGLSTVSQTIAPLILPLLVQQFVGESNKGAAYGTLRLWALMLALLMQALWGMFSDRSTLRWGRRRPFILFGTIADLLFVAAIGFAAGLSGPRGYWFLVGAYMLLQVSSNAAHAAQQALIPDIIPEARRGRASSLKAILELPLPTILVAFTTGKLIGQGQLWAGLGVMSSVLILTMVAAMLVPETPNVENQPPLDWRPLLRLALMTALFTLIILGLGGVVRLVSAALATVTDPSVLFAVMGLTGVIAMAIAVGLGVWASVWLSIGPKAARERPSFTWWVVNRLAYLVGAINLSTFAVFFLQGRLGLVREQAAGPAALLMMVVGVFILASALPSGWLADRFSRKTLIAVAGGLAAAGTLIAIVAPTLPVIYVGGCLIGIATGLFYTANWALGTQLVPAAEAGRYLGISNLAGAGAGAVGAYIGGPIADYFTARLPDQPGMGYLLLFAIYGVLFVLSIAALRGVREPARN